MKSINVQWKPYAAPAHMDYQLFPVPVKKEIEIYGEKCAIHRPLSSGGFASGPRVNSQGWMVTHIRSGMGVINKASDTIADAIRDALARCNAVGPDGMKKAIDHCLKKYGEANKI